MPPLYLARIEDLGRGDLVQVDCAACHHVALLTPDFLLRLGLNPRVDQSSLAGDGRGLGDCVSSSELGINLNDL
jgi:hypothetical protein